jgi:hypothetical protein
MGRVNSSLLSRSEDGEVSKEGKSEVEEGRRDSKISLLSQRSWSVVQHAQGLVCCQAG